MCVNTTTCFYVHRLPTVQDSVSRACTLLISVLGHLPQSRHTGMLNAHLVKVGREEEGEGKENTEDRAFPHRTQNGSGERSGRLPHGVCGTAFWKLPAVCRHQRHGDPSQSRLRRQGSTCWGERSPQYCTPHPGGALDASGQ